MPRLLLIHAGPTPWDVENRVVGAHGLPLTSDAVAAAKSLVEALPDGVTAIYLSKANEACLQVGKMLAARFNLRLRDRPELAEMNLGLWQGLTRDELARRYPTVIPQWQEAPLTVRPPEGESLEDAVNRVRPGLDKILRRNRGGGTVVLVLRPLVMQIVHGLLRHEEPQVIAKHLQNVDVMETMEVEQ
jgi:broad specificity phosphatase PhoE